MTVSPEHQQLLDAVRRTTEETHKAYQDAHATAERRREALHAAMQTKMPRDLIAEAAGTDLSLVYRALKKRSR